MHYFKTKPASAVEANVLQEENCQPMEDGSSSNWFSQIKGVPSVTYKASKQNLTKFVEKQLKQATWCCSRFRLQRKDLLSLIPERWLSDYVCVSH